MQNISTQTQHPFDFTPPSYGGMQNEGRMRFLYDCVINFTDKNAVNALEIGCFRGCSTVFLAKACQKADVKKVSTIDLFTGTPGWNQTYDTYEEMADRIKQYDLTDYVELIRGNSHDIEWDTPIGVLHIDGDHEYEAVKKDLTKFSQYLIKGGIIVLDDYDQHHNGVRKATLEFLLDNPDYDIVGINFQGDEWGSICIKKHA